MAVLTEAGTRCRWRFLDDTSSEAAVSPDQPSPETSNLETSNLEAASSDGAPVDTAAAQALAESLKLHPLVARLLCRRGYGEDAAARRFLYPKLTHLHDPALLAGCDDAAKRLVQAVRDGQPIVIYGDYDVDGVTASSILWHTLRHVDADVQVYVPHRLEEGYGINANAIVELGQPGTDGKTPLIISVDCGITAVEPAKVAREAGVDLIITDHHEFDADALPDAFALVHPRLPNPQHDNQPYPFDGLCGAGVAFKLAWQFMRVFFGSERLPDASRELLIDLVSLAALGTVADVMPLVDENRVLTWYGLGRIKDTRFDGLNALIDAAALRDAKIDAVHVGFVLGPRLNACGRMGHAKDAVRLLTEARDREAAKIAEQLTQENQRRQATERSITDQAKAIVEAEGYDAADRRAIVVGQPGWHPGVVGIVASRLVDTYGRPAIVLNYDTGEGSTQREATSDTDGADADGAGAGEFAGLAHGSARSVKSVNLYEVLQGCADMLTGFGGHAMAAGLRLPIGDVDRFRDAFIEQVNAVFTEEELRPLLRIEAACELEDVDLPLCQQVQRIGPFGPSNRRPLLCVRDVVVAHRPQRVGQKGAHLRLTVKNSDTGRVFRQAFGRGLGELADALPAGVHADLVFEPRLGEWQGVKKIEMHLRDVRVLG